MAQKAVARLSLQPLRLPDGGLPSGHLEKINALLKAKGKNPLTSEQVIVRPIRLTGNQMTDQYTKFPDSELERFAVQINSSGAPMLSAHMTDETPMGQFYQAGVTVQPDGVRWLDTYAYWIATDDGIELAQQIDAGIINEASIGVYLERRICSISGLNYYDSRYYAGEEYDITDPQTGVTTRQLCFRWLVGCEIAEGSLCYRGSHPGTQVGGVLPAAFTLSFDSDPQASLKRPNVTLASPVSPSLSPATGNKGETMNPRILLALGLLASASESDVVAALETRKTELEQLLRLTGSKTTSESLAVAAAWQQSHAALPEVMAQRDKLELEARGREVESLISEGQQKAQLTTEAQVAWARGLAPNDLRAFLAVQHQNPLLLTKPCEQPLDASQAAKNNIMPSSLTDDERLIIGQTGVDEKAFLAAKATFA